MSEEWKALAWGIWAGAVLVAIMEMAAPPFFADTEASLARLDSMRAEMKEREYHIEAHLQALHQRLAATPPDSHPNEAEP